VKSIAILFGGMTYEHEISIVSAITLKKVLKDHSLQFIFLDKHRSFYEIPENLMKSDTFSSGLYQKQKALVLQAGGFVRSGLLGKQPLKCDVVLNLMLTKHYARECGVKSLSYEVLSSGVYHTTIPFPVIVKPTHLGSSIGVGIASNQEELAYALDVAYEFDSSVIIEPFIKGVREYNLAGAFTNEGIVYSVIEEPQKSEFLDFEKKYLDFNRSQSVGQADVNEGIETRLKEAFCDLYKPLFRGALIRCDFFVIDDEVYLNEINPIPGSMANYLFEGDSGFGTLIDSMVSALPAPKTITIDYSYIEKIRSAKGKAG